MKSEIETAGSIELSGFAMLQDPLCNKGTAFSDEERDALGLRGLLPPHVETLDEQVERARAMIDEVDKPIEKYLRLRDLQDDRNICACVTCRTITRCCSIRWQDVICPPPCR